MLEGAHAVGRFFARCYDRHGLLKWRDEFPNLVVTEGKNLCLDTFFAGAAYTVTGPFMGLISSVSYTAVAITDVGSQINGSNGWTEAGGANAPTYTGNRKTVTWNAAGSGTKSIASTQTYAITGSGTVKGVFMLLGTGAVATKDSAAGTLWSAGLFSADRGVASSDSLIVGYSTSL